MKIDDRLTAAELRGPDFCSSVYKRVVVPSDKHLSNGVTVEYGDEAVFYSYAEWVQLRLWEYENTGLSPEEIVELSAGSRKIGRMRRGSSNRVVDENVSDGFHTWEETPKETQ